MDNPLISVIIPAHNSAQTIGIAIQSILDQTYQNLEIIIVDDNSTDSTENAIRLVRDMNKEKTIPIKYFKLPFNDPNRLNKKGRNINAGYSARNFAFDKINGSWVTFQDADDASLKNRIEVQYKLAQKYDATHICLDWMQFTQERVGNVLDIDTLVSKTEVKNKKETYELSQKTKGWAYKILGEKICSIIPFEVKQLRIINKLFWGSLEQYPGTGNSPLFKREILEKVKFRSLKERVWSSFVGRGADRDFNFQVAETFKNSVVVFLPLYLWRQNHENKRYEGYEKYLK
jgi:glycosyltransferase involved in cell wall biosynthesis